MPKKNLTDRTLVSLRNNPPESGQRIDVMDTVVPGFGVRVNDAGKLTFILNVRFPGDQHPSRRTIGTPGTATAAAAKVFTLADARAEALRWKGMIATGRDPREEAAKALRDTARVRSNTFAAVAEDFIAAMEPTERCRDEVAAAIRREFIKPWNGRPIVEITPLDVLDIVKAIKGKGHSHQARNVLGHARRLFSWAIAQHVYGLERSPCAELRPKLIIGAKRPRKRILTDAEIRAAWNAATDMGYPYGDSIKMLMLTGQRTNEIAQSSRPEFDEAIAALVIPAERMKMDEPHIVPLCDQSLTVINALPKHTAGDFLFSTTLGRKPISSFSKTKTRLDEAMTAELGAKPAPWQIRDIRRTVRTHLSALPIPQHVCERIIAHAQPGLIQTYDRFAFTEEKRQGLKLWAERLSRIVAPKAGEIVSLVDRRAALAN